MTDEELAHYTAALDEIYRLRTALAYEATVLEAHLDYKTFPKARRAFAEEQVQRMNAAARGDRDSHTTRGPGALEQARRMAGMNILTRWQWENHR